ncbi:MAG: hypothetical protein ACTSXH_16375 [Promethearchaeota archaeon]
MIYKVFLIDGESGISLLEASFKEFKKRKITKTIIFPNFFRAINDTIDNIHAAMAKGRKINEMLRLIESEDATMIIFYHPLSRVLCCSISDADDDLEQSKNVIQQIGSRFWKKHSSDIEFFRTTGEKNRFSSFIIDIEILTMGGKIAEKFPKLLLNKSILEKVFSTGIIDNLEYKIALACTGEASSLKIARQFQKPRKEIEEILKKLEQLEIIIEERGQTNF